MDQCFQINYCLYINTLFYCTTNVRKNSGRGIASARDRTYDTIRNQSCEQKHTTVQSMLIMPCPYGCLLHRSSLGINRKAEHSLEH